MLQRMWNFISLIWTDGFQLKYIVPRPVRLFYCSFSKSGLSGPGITFYDCEAHYECVFFFGTTDDTDASHITDP